MRLSDQMGKRILFFDGGMGTLLQSRGLGAGELPEPWNLTHPDRVAHIQASYRAAGADILKTNTFGANSVKLAGSGWDAKPIVAAAVAIARKAAGDGLVAMDIGPTGKLLKPLGDLDFEQAYDAFAQAAVEGERAGADLILIETMNDTYECKAAVLAAKQNTRLPVFVTLLVDGNGRLMTGGDIPCAVAMLEGLGVDAVGLNCGAGPKQMLMLLPQLTAAASVPIVVNPNAGLPRDVDGTTVFDVRPDAFSQIMRQIALGGAWIIGGCCGTTPEYIARTVKLCRNVRPRPISRKTRTIATSFSKSVDFGKGPVIIGERLNPTGKPALKQALRQGDMDYVLREGIAQQQKGANVLDVNVGLPGLDESAVLREVVGQLQGVIDLPLQIDTSNPSAMEAAMRVYNGKPIVNSVNGKAESMQAVFPLVKKYGGIVIALTLDEKGIPPTARGRLEVARKIVSAAEAYGIEKRDIVVDTLALTVSTGGDNARIALEALRLVREELCVCTSLGVSNVSYGLPRRDVINTMFLTMALQAGLNAAIVNPNSSSILDVFSAYAVLSGKDENCSSYIARFRQQVGDTAVPAKTSEPEEPDLEEAIVRGLRESAKNQAAVLLRREAPLAIINSRMIPALDRVGKGFEQGTVYLPQLMMCAEAAHAAFDVIREKMSGGSGGIKKGKIVLATVQGDIHDIGKNIVKVLLQNYGYDVIDLGRDVAPEKILEAVRKNRVRLVGLSALMTTTVVNMEATIRLLHHEAPDCRVMVGGAVLTAEYARKIHADRYGRDAMGAVRIAQELFGADEAVTS